MAFTRDLATIRQAVPAVGGVDELASRRKHPGGTNLFVALHPTERRVRTFRDVEVEVLSPYPDAG